MTATARRRASLWVALGMFLEAIHTACGPDNTFKGPSEFFRLRSLFEDPADLHQKLQILVVPNFLRVGELGRRLLANSSPLRKMVLAFLQSPQLFQPPCQERHDESDSQRRWGSYL